MEKAVVMHGSIDTTKVVENFVSVCCEVGLHRHIDQCAAQLDSAPGFVCYFQMKKGILIVKQFD